jgi:hypothetical protein
MWRSGGDHEIIRLSLSLGRGRLWRHFKRDVGIVVPYTRQRFQTVKSTVGEVKWPWATLTSESKSDLIIYEEGIPECSGDGSS